MAVAHGNGVAILLRPCGVEVSTSRGRYHWSNVIKAASYLLAKSEQGHLHPKGVRGQEHDVKRLMKSQYQGP
jgi:hypothetical protein